jgi:PTH1 family peptidyl-tRNA hydrolase
VKRLRKLKRLLRPKTRKRPKSATTDPMRVVVGLRNPGSDYEGTRHNVGYEVVARVVERALESFTKAPSRLRAHVARSGVGAEATLFVTPVTYMNESGRAVRAVLDYYKVGPEDLLVVHDDIDLEFGRLRLQVAGGSGGHNGIRSLEEALGTKEFSRLKVGVGRPPGSMDPARYVLHPFTVSERPEADLMVEDAADVVERWLIDRQRAQEQAAHRGRDG